MYDYKKSQILYGKKLIKKLVKKGCAYLIAPPRAGKTATAIYACEHIDKIKKIVVVTKPTALKGWQLFTDSSMCSKYYTITTQRKALNLDLVDYNCVIFDESHTITANVGRPTDTYNKLRAKFFDMPQILISATPTVETKNSLYYQMTKSKFNPFFKYKSFYKFFKAYGIPDPTMIGNGMTVETYKKSNKKLDKVFKKYSVGMKNNELRKTVDKLIYVKLSEKQRKLYNTLITDNYAEYKKQHLVGDTVMGLRVLLHQIEGGTVKTKGGKVVYIKDNPKLEYIAKLSGKIGVMSHFQGERAMLKEKLGDKIEIYSSNAHSEGVDLSHLDHLVILSQDYSGAKHIQRRDRVVNMNKTDNNLTVTYLLVKGAISDQVYKTCSQKKNFNDKLFKRSKI